MSAAVEYIDPTPGTTGLPLAPVRYTSTTPDRIEAKSARNRYFLDLDQAAKDARLRPAPRLVAVKDPRPAREPKPQKPPLRPCADCGRTTRPRTQEWSRKEPGIIARARADKCARCTKRAIKATADTPQRQLHDTNYVPNILPCVTCGTDTRPDTTPAATARPDLPRRVKGNCANCYKISRRTTDRATMPKVRVCPGCGKATRPSRSSLTDYPGTKARHSGEHCMACYQAARRAGK